MLESLLVGRYGIHFSRVVPNPGPGGDTIIGGGKDAGYMGEVGGNQWQYGGGSVDFNTGITGLIRDHFGPDGGLIRTDPNNRWFKFIYNNRIILMPSLPLSEGMTQRMLYDYSALSGSDLAIDHPEAASALRQDARIVLLDDQSRRYVFRLRTMYSTAANTGVSGSSIATSTLTNIGGEYRDIWGNFFNGAFVSPDSPRPQYGRDKTYYDDKRFIVSEMREHSGNAITGSSDVPAVLDKLDVGFNVPTGYRPVLEYLYSEESAEYIAKPVISARTRRMTTDVGIDEGEALPVPYLNVTGEILLDAVPYVDYSVSARPMGILDANAAGYFIFDYTAQ